MKNEITLPYKFIPRDYQLPLLEAMDGGITRAVVVWHRRSGKDKSFVNIFPKKMLERVGAYYYFFPTYKQGKRVLWEGMDKEGFPFLNHFPKELLASKPNDTEMKLKFKNGSIFQVIGTEDIDLSAIGSNPMGVAFSEYALQKPGVWDYIRPILRENEGWAIFCFTPRGENHAHELYLMAEENKDWFCELLTADDTKAVTKAMIQEERNSGMSEELIQQEYYCSFTAAILGSYYAKEIREARNNNRFCNVPYEPSLPVYSVWDLGVSDTMSIGLFQSVGREKRMIDYYENTGEGLAHYAKVLQNKEYVYGKHFAPFDIKIQEMGTGKTRLEVAAKLGIKFEIVPSMSREDGIDTARRFFKRLWVDKTKCKEWIRAIPNYTKKYNEEKKVFSNTPDHNWASHPADMLRYAAIVADEMTNEKTKYVETPSEPVSEYQGEDKPAGHPVLQGTDISKW